LKQFGWLKFAIGDRNINIAEKGSELRSYRKTWTTSLGSFDKLP